MTAAHAARAVALPLRPIVRKPRAPEYFVTVRATASGCGAARAGLGMW